MQSRRTSLISSHQPQSASSERSLAPSQVAPVDSFDATGRANAAYAHAAHTNADSNDTNTPASFMDDQSLNPHQSPTRYPANGFMSPDSLARSHSFVAPSSSEDGVVISEELLLNFQRCDRRAFLDIYGNPDHRDPPSDYLQKLHQDSIEHQKTVITDWPAVIPAYPHRDWAAGAAATLDLMRQGVERISRGVLLGTHTDGTVLLSRPKLLVRQPGASIFGNWHYMAVDIKLGKRAKSDYQVIAAYHTHVLADVQDAWPETSLLILRHQNTYHVDLFEQVPKMLGILDNCVNILQTRQEPQVFIARNRCDLCHWFSQCYTQAKDINHLSLLPGVTPNRYAYLKTLNLTSVASLAAISPDALGDLPGFGGHVAQKLVRQAQATHTRQPLLTLHGETLLRQRTTSVHQLLPSASVEIYFDIEAAPERELIYLHGVLAVDRSTDTHTFHGLLADHPDDERRIWEEFLALAHGYPDAPIFHFCPYEYQTVRKLASFFDTPAERVEPLLERFVDVHDCIVQMVTLPIESYALKAIARWVGFDWRDEGANGAQSIYWYDQWLETGDRTFLDTILRYNEDDCRATWLVKDWLSGFLSEKLTELSAPQLHR